MSYGYGNQRGGGRGRPQGRQGQGDDFLNTTKFHRLARSTEEFVVNQRTGKEEGKIIAKDVVVPEGIKEELTISFSADKVQEFFAKIQEAMNSEEGTGGITMRFYTVRRVFRQGQPARNATHVNVWPTRPYQDNGGRRGFGGGQGGRKSYPPSGGRSQGYGEDYGGNEDASEDTAPASRKGPGGQTQGSSKGGYGRTAPGNASPSNVKEEQTSFPGLEESKRGMRAFDEEDDGPPVPESYI